MSPSLVSSTNLRRSRRSFRDVARWGSILRSIRNVIKTSSKHSIGPDEFSYLANVHDDTVRKKTAVRKVTRYNVQDDHRYRSKRERFLSRATQTKPRNESLSWKTLFHVFLLGPSARKASFRWYSAREATNKINTRHCIDDPTIRSFQGVRYTPPIR